MAAPVHGAVAAGDSQTAEAGAQALRAGGNAADAAIAAALAAFVCEPPLCSPLGGGVLVHRAATKEVRSLGFFGRTPGLGASSVPEDLDFHDVSISFGATTQTFHIGRGAAAVPLALPGLFEAQSRWGALPLREVVAPAVNLARGYVLSAPIARIFEILAPIVEYSEGTRAIYQSGGVLAPAGARMRNADLGNALEQMARDPRDIQQLLSQLVREFGPQEGGLLTQADVEALQFEERIPVRIACGDWVLTTMPPPSSGGVLVALGLRLLEGVGERHRFLSPGHYEEIAKVQKTLANLRGPDFDATIGEPERVAQLLSDDTVARLRSAPPDAEPPGNLLGSTTHVSAIDQAGAAMAITLTNGEGCGHVLHGTGIHVNNLLGEEDINPSGFHQDPPGHVMVTMMSPTLLEHPDGRSVALGSGGSNRLRNAILSVASHLIEHGQPPRHAVDAPRVHIETAARQGGRVSHDLAFERSGLDPAADAALRRAVDGETAAFDEPSMFFGGVHVAARGAAGRVFEGAGDPRRGGAVVVV